MKKGHLFQMTSLLIPKSSFALLVIDFQTVISVDIERHTLKMKYQLTDLGQSNMIASSLIDYPVVLFLIRWQQYTIYHVYNTVRGVNAREDCGTICKPLSVFLS